MDTSVASASDLDMTGATIKGSAVRQLCTEKICHNSNSTCLPCFRAVTRPVLGSLSTMCSTNVISTIVGANRQFEARMAKKHHVHTPLHVPFMYRDSLSDHPYMRFVAIMLSDLRSLLFSSSTIDSTMSSVAADSPKGSPKGSLPTTPKELHGDKPRRRSLAMETAQAALQAQSKRCAAGEETRSVSAPPRPKKMPRTEGDGSCAQASAYAKESQRAQAPHSAMIPPPPYIGAPIERDDSKIFACPLCAWKGRNPTSRYLHLGLQHSVIKPLLSGRPQQSTSGDKLFVIPITRTTSSGAVDWAGHTEYQAYKTVLSNAAKLDEEGLRQITALKQLPSAEELPPASRITAVPDALLSSYYGNDAIRIHHSGAIVWTKPWNTWYNKYYESKPAQAAKKSDEGDVPLLPVDATTPAGASAVAADVPIPTPHKEDATDPSSPIPTIDLVHNETEIQEPPYQEPTELQDPKLVEVARRQWMTLSGQVGNQQVAQLASSAPSQTETAETTGHETAGSASMPSGTTQVARAIPNQDVSVNVADMIWQSLQCLGTTIIGSQSLVSNTLSNQLDLHGRVVALEQLQPIVQPTGQSTSSVQPSATPTPPVQQMQYDVPKLIQGVLKRVQFLQNKYEERIMALEDSVATMRKAWKGQKAHNEQTQEAIKNLTSSVKDRRDWIFEKLSEQST
eukprot:6369416-Amphidinium_carterae.2